jgi:hypothetical protein
LVEVFDSIETTFARVCLDLEDQLYEIRVYAIGFDRQASVSGTPVMVSTGPADLCDPDPCVPFDPDCLPVDYKSLAVGSFALLDNHPNPFNTSTLIRFSTDGVSLVTLDVYNILGQQIARVIEDVVPAGPHQVEWDGRDWKGRSVPSGVYVYRLSSGSKSASHKMVILR